MDKDIILDFIFANDPLGLLNIKPKASSIRTADERLSASFQEINEFYEKHGREPEPTMSSIAEYKLFSRLKSIRENDEKRESLAMEDHFNLLGKKQKEITSIEDIFSADALDILGGGDEGLYDFKHTPKDFQREDPDYIAQRQPCDDFENFEHLFLQCHSDLRKGHRKLFKFKKEQQIDEGNYFVLKGILVYVAHKDELQLKRGKKDARLRLIYENGTESDLLMRSLARSLYRDGKRVTEHESKNLEGMERVNEEDQEMGLIYVLESLSEHPEIKGLKNLYKIGYTKSTLAARLKNAEKEKTFLLAKVREVRSYKCYNLNAQKLEMLLHAFFGRACLNVEIQVGKRRVKPREWFVVPLEIIDDVVGLIDNGQIVHYRYDVEAAAIVAR